MQDFYERLLPRLKGDEVPKLKKTQSRLNLMAPISKEQRDSIECFQLLEYILGRLDTLEIVTNDLFELVKHKDEIIFGNAEKLSCISTSYSKLEYELESALIEVELIDKNHSSAKDSLERMSNESVRLHADIAKVEGLLQREKKKSKIIIDEKNAIQKIYEDSKKSLFKYSLEISQLNILLDELRVKCTKHEEMSENIDAVIFYPFISS